MSVAIPGGMALARHLRRRSILIALYHGVVEQPLPVFNWCQLPRDDFEKQIAFLTQEYRVLPLPEVIEKLRQGRTLPERIACITFDDGFRSILSTAYPVLHKYQAPATVFLVTSLIGSPDMPWPEQLYCALTSSDLLSIDVEGAVIPLQKRDDKAAAYARISGYLKKMSTERKQVALAGLLDRLGQSWQPASIPMSMLSWDEVKRLHGGSLISFGSHTHTHPILSRSTLESQRMELVKSRDLIREHLGNSDLFAYPNGARGDYTEDTKRLLVETGYRCALTAIRGINSNASDPYELRRVDSGAGMSFSEFLVGLLGR